MSDPVPWRERTFRKWREPTVSAIDVHWWNLPAWIAKTVAVDLRDYQRPPTRRRRLIGHFDAPLRRPIFIVGAPRSGTSFLGGCLALADEISYHREPVVIQPLVRQVYERTIDRDRAARAFTATYQGLLRLQGDGGARVADKTPRNAFIMDFLDELFPDAQFIHAIRDGRDAAVSYSEKPWSRAVYGITRRRAPDGQPYGPFAHFWVEGDRREEFESTSDVHRAAWTWRRHVEAALAHGRRLPDDRYLEVRYEDLMTAGTESAHLLGEFLGLSADSTEALVRATAHGSPRSIGRWREKVDAEGQRQIEREAGTLLEELGYGA